MMGKALSGELSCPCDRSCFLYFETCCEPSLEPSHRDSSNEGSQPFVFVSPAKQKQDICIAFPASSFFCVYIIFSETIMARAMKLGSCIHLKELRSTLRSILSHVLLFTVH